MSTTEILWSVIFRGVSALSAAIAVLCAVYVAWRASSWRNNDAEKAREQRLAGVENECSGIKQRLSGMPSKSDVDIVQGRIGKVEKECSNLKTRLESVATKADLEALKSDVRAVFREVSSVDAGVIRIEQFLMEKSK